MNTDQNNDADAQSSSAVAESYSAAVREVRDMVSEKQREAEFMLDRVSEHDGDPEEYKGKIRACTDVLEALDAL